MKKKKTVLNPDRLLEITNSWFIFARNEAEGDPTKFQVVRTVIGDSFEEALLEHRITLAMVGVYSVPAIIKGEYNTTQIAGYVFQKGAEPTGKESVRFVSLAGRWFSIQYGRFTEYGYDNWYWSTPQILSVVRIEEFASPRGTKKMNSVDFIRQLHRSFIAMERSEIVVHHKTRLHSFGDFILRALANPECNGSNEAIEAILSERSKRNLENESRKKAQTI